MTLPEVRVERQAITVIEHYKRIVSATSKGIIRQSDVDFVVVSAVTKFTQEVERQLQKLFVQLMLGKRTLPNVEPLVSIKSSVVLHNHLKEGRPYADWLPYSKTVERAKRYLSRGKPFTDMNSQHYLDELQTIRNALVHDSQHSRNRFENRVLANRSVPRYEQNPTRYLRGLATNTESRLEQHLTSATVAFRELVQ